MALVIFQECICTEHLGNKRIFVNGRKNVCTVLQTLSATTAYSIKISGWKTYSCAGERNNPIGKKYSFSLSLDFEWISRNKTEEKPPCELI